MFTGKEITIIKALLEEEIFDSSFIDGEGGAGTLDLLENYRSSLSEITCKLDGFEEEKQIFSKNISHNI